MGQPWGLSGPEFLGVYAAGVAASHVLTTGVRALLCGGPGPDGSADVYTLAMAAGGRDRVVDTAVRALMADQRIRVGRDHLLRAVEEDTAAAAVRDAYPVDDVQGEVLTLVGKVTTNLRGARKAVGGTAAVRKIEEDTVRAGIRLSSARRRAVLASGLLLQGAVFGMGVARLANGVRLHRPVGFLVVLLAVTAVLVVVAARRAPRLTRGGRRWLDAHRADERRGLLSWPDHDPAAAGATVVPDSVTGVAAFGAAGMTQDPTLRMALYGGLAGASGSSSGSGSSCSSFTSSCGGSCGGGCGGGCGG